jgi:hypothetical protein
MSHPDTIRHSILRDAIAKLALAPAKALRNDTCFQLPPTMRIADADLCTHLARNESSFLVLPDHSGFDSRLVLRTTNEAWKHDKLPTIAICPTVQVARQVQRTTGIESVCAEGFFDDLERTRPVVQSFTGKKSYVIGHDHNPKGRFDQVVLPYLANVIVFDAEHFSSEQLTSLCEPISQVGGRLILCGDQNALDRAHPDLAEAINDAVRQGLHVVPFTSYRLEKAWGRADEFQFYRSTLDNAAHRPTDSKFWVIVATSSWDHGPNAVRSIHSSHEDALNSVPAVFAEVWNDYMFLHRGDWNDSEQPSVSTAEWSLPIAPEIGDAVHIENHAVVSLISLDELRYSSDDFRQDSRATDPLADTRPFLIFHAKSDESTLFPDHYKLVARLEAENINHAVFLSQQHSEVPWTQYPGVTPFADKPRSTRIGDVIIDHDIPRRYVADNDWRPVMTVEEPVHIHERAPASIEPFPKPEPVNHTISAASRKF